MNKLIKSISFVALANFISLFVAGLISILLPKFISVESYGYWQLYLLFITYIGCIHLGIPDGIYLRYSGRKYQEIANAQVKKSFWILAIWEIFFSLVIFLLYSIQYTSIIGILFAICTVIYLPALFLRYVILASNMMEEYATYLIIEKIVSIILIVLFLVYGFRNVSYYIVADIIGKSISLIYLLKKCNYFLVKSLVVNQLLKREFIENFKSGFCLMVSNVSSNFIVGAVKVFTERHWSIEHFSKLSLSLQISNLVLAFVRAVSLPLFPYIRRQNEENLKMVYISIRSFLVLIIGVLLIIYFPLKVFLDIWLPDYQESVIYLGVLFPICLFEAKQSLVCEVFLKNFRKEKFLLMINVITMIISVTSSYIVIYIHDNRNLSILLIVILLAFRNIISEIYLCRVLREEISFEFLKEILLVIVFMLATQILTISKGIVVYFLFLMLFLLSNIKKYKVLLHRILKTK